MNHKMYKNTVEEQRGGRDNKIRRWNDSKTARYRAYEGKEESTRAKCACAEPRD